MRLPTCKEVSQLASDALEGQLTRRQRWGLRLHLWVCENCRRFVRHLHFLHEASRRVAEETALPARMTLSKEARDRIKKGLGAERGGFTK